MIFVMLNVAVCSMIFALLIHASVLEIFYPILVCWSCTFACLSDVNAHDTRVKGISICEFLNVILFP